MWDRKQKIIYRFFSLFVACSLGITAFACNSGSTKQVGGIVGEVQFSTEACVPQQKVIKIRNDDTTNPQRVMGVYFELGTNVKSLFKVEKVVVGSTEYSPENAITQEVLIPAGGIMSVYTRYNTRKATRSPDVSYLDFFLNGPKLGILQIKMTGEAPSAAEGCTEGESKRFRVVKVEQKIKDGSNADVAAEDITTITDPFILEVSGTTATISKDGFPSIPIPAPGLVVTADLGDGEYSGSFEGGHLTIEDVEVATSAGLSVTVTLTTESLTETNNGEVVSLTIPGSPLADGSMKVALIAKLPEVSQLGALSHGLFGAILHLEEEAE